MRFAPTVCIALHLAGAAAFAAPAPVVIQNATIFDSRTGSLLSGRSILIEDGIIRKIADQRQPIRGISGARVIDAGGKFLIPGLIDSHVHLVHILSAAHMTGDEVLPLFLANGVTTVRDTGDDVIAEKLVSRYAESHPELAPRVFMGSLLIDGQPPYHKGPGRAIEDPDDVPPFLDDMSVWGVRTVKLYVGVQRTVGKRVIEEAHRRGLPVTGHLGRYSVQEAIADGIDCLEHIDTILDFVYPPDAPRLPPPHMRQGLSAADIANFRRRTYELNANLDLGSPRVAALVKLLADHKTTVDPTLTVARNWLLLRDTTAVLNHPDNSRMPERLRRYWTQSNDATTVVPDSLELRKGQLRKELALTGLLFRSGIRLLAGTDSPVQFCPPGFALHQELELLVEAGLPPAAALQAATINGATAIREDSRLGSIEEGKMADLVVLDANPLEDIRNTRKVNLVIRSGHVLDPHELLQKVARK